VSDSNVIKLAQPGAFTDCLTEILRSAEEIATEIFELPVDVVRRILCHYDQKIRR
jgi:hypothetical protein